jgi:uncharacterized protein with HEPN domain
VAEIVGMRNILIHQYFSADRELVEAVVENELPQLVQAVTEMLELQGS